MATWLSSNAFPTANFHPTISSCPLPTSTAVLTLRLLPIHMLQLPVTTGDSSKWLSMSTSWLQSLSVVRNTVCGSSVWFSHHLWLSQISCVTLWQPQMLPALPSNWSRCEDLSSASASRWYLHHPQVQVQSHSLLFLFLLPSSYQVVHGSIYSFPVVRRLASTQLVLCDNFCLLKRYSGASMERYIPHSSTSPPSCWLSLLYLKQTNKQKTFFLLLFWPHCAACRNLVHRSKIEPIPLQWRQESLKYWLLKSLPNVFSISGTVFYSLRFFFVFDNFY